MGRNRRRKRSNADMAAFKSNAEMPVFEHFPMREEVWPSSSSNIHYGN